MKIDFHVHTKERSACARVSEGEQIRAAIQAGLDGIAITDHERLVPQKRLQALNEQFAPFKIFTGIEVGAEDHHWVVLGIHDSSLERWLWRWKLPDLWNFVHDRGGFIILAHPFRYQNHLPADLNRYPPDGIEIQSINTPVDREADIRAVAARLGLVLFHNTDAHRVGDIGRYHNELPRPARDDRELVDVLIEMKNQQKMNPKGAQDA